MRPTRACSSNRFVYNFQALIHSRQALRAQYHVAEFTGEREWTIIPAPVEPQRCPRERAALRGTVYSGVRKFDYFASCHGAACIDKRDDPAELAQIHATHKQQKTNKLSAPCISSRGDVMIRQPWQQLHRTMLFAMGGAVAPTQRLLPGVSTWRFFFFHRATLRWRMHAA